MNLLRFLLKNWPFFRLYIPFLRGQSQPFWAPWVHFGSPRQTDFGATGVNFVGKNQIYILYVNLHCVLVRNEFGGNTLSTRDLGFLPSWNGSPSNPPGHCWAPKSLSHLSVSRVQKHSDKAPGELRRYHHHHSCRTCALPYHQVEPIGHPNIRLALGRLHTTTTTGSVLSPTPSPACSTLRRQCT